MTGPDGSYVADEGAMLFVEFLRADGGLPRRLAGVGKAAGVRFKPSTRVARSVSSATISAGPRRPPGWYQL